jgi:hypothetical protein
VNIAVSSHPPPPSSYEPINIVMGHGDSHRSSRPRDSYPEVQDPPRYDDNPPRYYRYSRATDRGYDRDYDRGDDRRYPRAYDYDDGYRGRDSRDYPPVALVTRSNAGAMVRRRSMSAEPIGRVVPVGAAAEYYNAGQASVSGEKSRRTKSKSRKSKDKDGESSRGRARDKRGDDKSRSKSKGRSKSRGIELAAALAGAALAVGGKEAYDRREGHPNNFRKEPAETAALGAVGALASYEAAKAINRHREKKEEEKTEKKEKRRKRYVLMTEDTVNLAAVPPEQRANAKNPTMKMTMTVIKSTMENILQRLPSALRELLPRRMQSHGISAADLYQRNAILIGNNGRTKPKTSTWMKSTHMLLVLQ